MGEKPTEAEEPTPQLVAGSIAGSGATYSSRNALSEPVVAAVSSSAPEAAPVEEETNGSQPVRFAYVCYHCGAHREVDSEGYVSECSTCGQSLKSGREQMEAVARGEHVPTYDRTSPYYP